MGSYPPSPDFSGHCPTVTGSLSRRVGFNCYSKIFLFPPLAPPESKVNACARGELSRRQVPEPAAHARVAHFQVVCSHPSVECPVNLCGERRDKAKRFAHSDARYRMIERPHLNCAGSATFRIAPVGGFNAVEANAFLVAAHE